MMSGTKPDITIYLNRVTEGVIYLRLLNQPQGKYYLQLINKAGQVIIRKLIVHTGGSSTELIKCNHILSHGVYLLELTKPGGCKKNINVLY